MNLLDRLLGHDDWTTRRLLELAAPLPDDDLDREFDLGKRTLRATFDHMIRNVEVWTDLMRSRAARERAGTSIAELMTRHDASMAEFSALANEIESRGAWDESWMDREEAPPKERTFGGTIAHVITHNMHHRSQLLFMLRRLGVQDVPEGDVLSWEEGSKGTELRP